MPELSQWPVMIAVCSIAYFGIVAVHECGHYLAGRAIGIPRRNMRIRLLTFPQHVALRDGDEWISPVHTDRYIKLAEPLMPTTASALLFVGGGFIMETAALLGWVTLRLPFCGVISCLAFGMTAIYLLYDMAIFLITRRASMDFSAMYSISPVFGSLFVVAVVGVQFYIVTLR